MVDACVEERAWGARHRPRRHGPDAWGFVVFSEKGPGGLAAASARDSEARGGEAAGDEAAFAGLAVGGSAGGGREDEFAWRNARWPTHLAAMS